MNDINCDINWDLTLKVVQIIIFGGLGLCIANKQYEINNKRYLLDLYDRRIKIYNYVLNLLDIAIKGNIREDGIEKSYQSLSKQSLEFYEKNYEYKFLYTPEFCHTIDQVIDQCRELGTQLFFYKDIINNSQEKEQQQKLTDKIREIRKNLEQKLLEEIKKALPNEMSKDAPLFHKLFSI
jgi:hypothetical protein